MSGLRIIDPTPRPEDVEDLRPHPENPRRGDVALIARLIGENGWHGVVVVWDEEGVVIDGWHRVEACRRVGRDSVPVLRVSASPEAARAYMLAANRLPDLGDTDGAAAVAALRSLGGLRGTGYDADDFDRLAAAVAPPAPRTPAEPRVPRPPPVRVAGVRAVLSPAEASLLAGSLPEAIPDRLAEIARRAGCGPPGAS